MQDHPHTPERRLPAVERLAERFGALARAQTIFGEPVERNGITVIPVARVRWGLGGGWGEGGDKSSPSSAGGTGGGAGGGMMAEPSGYIEISASGTRYRPIIDPLAWFKAALLGGVLGLLVSRWKRW